MDVFLCVYVCLILNFPLEKLVFASNCLRQETKSLIFKEPIPNYLCSKNGCLPIINVRKLQKKVFSIIVDDVECNPTYCLE